MKHISVSEGITASSSLVKNSKHKHTIVFYFYYSRTKASVTAVQLHLFSKERTTQTLWRLSFS